MPAKSTGDRVFSIGLRVAAVAILTLFGVLAYRSLHPEPRGKFQKGYVIRSTPEETCAQLHQEVSGSKQPLTWEACFATPVVDSSPWSSAGTTWHPPRPLAPGDCVQLTVNSEDQTEVRSVRWTGVGDCQR